MRTLRRRQLRWRRYQARYAHLTLPADPDLRLIPRGHARVELAVWRHRWRRVERWCVRCGCTDARACPGGCAWAEPGLCTSCAPPQIITIDTGGLL